MDLATLGLFASFGAIILAGYIKLIYRVYKEKDFKEKIWGYAKSKILRMIYMIMIAASFSFGIYLVYFFVTSPGPKEILYSGLVLLLAASAVWAWFPFTLVKIPVLALVATGALLLLVNSGMQLAEAPKNTNVIFAVVGCCVLFIQTFFFDFLIWNGLLSRLIS